MVSSKDNNYNPYAYEIDETEITVEPSKIKKVTIRFNKLYSNQAIIRKMVFDDVILNYEEYKITTNKAEYTNRSTITIEI